MENINGTKSSPKKPNIKMIGIILAAVILIILVAIMVSTSKKSTTNNETEVNNEPVSEQNGEGEGDGEKTPVNTVTTETGQVIPEGSRVEVAGANPIINNVVVTPTGEAVKNDVVPMSPEAPQQTAPITKETVPASAKKLDVSATGFSPASFEVKAGSVVTLSVSSSDANTHVFMFDDGALAAVAIGVGPSETRAITFNAPAKAGEYTFRCDVPGHSGRGEVGKMIVK